MKLLPSNLDAKTYFGRIPLRLYIVAAALLGVVLASYFLFVQPKNVAMASMRTTISDRRTKLAQLNVEMAGLDASRHKVEQLRKAIGAFESRLPRQGEIDVILREVWVIADAAGLKTQRIKTHKGKPQDGYRVLPIEMNLDGPFEGLYRFLLSLENLPGLMNVESLELTSPTGDRTGAVEASLVLHMFCKP